MPVIVTSEATIALMREDLTIPSPDHIEVVERVSPSQPPESFVPFSGMVGETPALPNLGTGYRVLHSLNPHDERGGIKWDPDVFEGMYERILGKTTCHRDDIVSAEAVLLEDAEVVVIAYGSESRPALDAVLQAREEGIQAGMLRPVTIWPLPDNEIALAAEKARCVLSVEMNVGKYVSEIERCVAGRCPVERLTKNRGEIHTPAEVYAAIKEAIGWKHT